jgi:hypothetical protein
VRFLRAAVELKIATGASAEALSDLFYGEHHGFFQRFLDRRLKGTESTIVDPSHRVGDGCFRTGTTSMPTCRGPMPNLVSEARARVARHRSDDRHTDHEAPG